MLDELAHPTLCDTTSTENLHAILSSIASAAGAVLLEEGYRAIEEVSTEDI